MVKLCLPCLESLDLFDESLLEDAPDSLLELDDELSISDDGSLFVSLTWSV